MHDNPILFSTAYTEFTIDLQVITYSNYINSDVTNRVEEAILNFFDVGKMEFGDDIFISSVVGEVMKVEGVRNVIVNSPLTDIEVPENSVAKLTAVNVVTTGGVEA